MIYVQLDTKFAVPRIQGEIHVVAVKLWAGGHYYPYCYKVIRH